MSAGMVAYHGEAQGHLARPTEGQGPWPGVLVLHDHWGLNEPLKAQAEALAEQGHLVLAVDLFEHPPTDPGHGEALGQALRPAEALAKLKAALATLKAHPACTGRLGALGWGLGGAWALALALEKGTGLAVCGAYEALPPLEAQALAQLPPAILHLGAADARFPPSQLAACREGLLTAGPTHHLVLHEGASAAFASPTRSEAYRPQQANEAWAATLAFFGQHLR